MMKFNWVRKPQRKTYPKTSYFDTWTKKKQRRYYETLLESTRAAERRATERWLTETLKRKTLEKELEKKSESSDKN